MQYGSRPGKLCITPVYPITPHAPTLQSTFESLDSSLQRICGKITFPKDNGHALIKKIDTSSNILFGSSNASLKFQKSTRAWILSSGDSDDIENPLLHITGSGPVDSYNTCTYVSLTIRITQRH
jgi:hypothetical protein